jgi:hypothetical protein
VSDSADNLDALIRAKLDRDAERVDPRALFARIVGAEPAKPRRAAKAAGYLGGVAVAAGLAFLFFGGLYYSRPGPASAETLVRDAQTAHHQPVDRCYLVEVRRESDALDESRRVTAQSQTTRLWTRGDRFWIESTNPHSRWAWGRDERGGVWLAFGAVNRGVRLDPDEVPRALEQASDLYSMQLETLLSNIRRDFTLTREPLPDSSGVLISATLKPGRYSPSLRGATLELDPETKVVRKVVLNRVLNGQPFATVSYTLVETGAQDDSKYQLEGHLPPDAKVLTRATPARLRDEVLRKFFGDAAVLPRDAKKP